VVTSFSFPLAMEYSIAREDPFMPLCLFFISFEQMNDRLERLPSPPFLPCHERRRCKDPVLSAFFLIEGASTGLHRFLPSVGDRRWRSLPLLSANPSLLLEKGAGEAGFPFSLRS